MRLRTGLPQAGTVRRRETDVDSPKSDQVFDCLVTLGHLADAVTCCATNSCLGWHAGLATALCEAQPTMSPTSVARIDREVMRGLCQQDGG